MKSATDEIRDPIVLSGAGVVSALGIGKEQFAQALYQPQAIAAPGPISDFQPERWLGSKGIRTLDRGTRMLCVAAQMALQDGKYSVSGAGDPRAGLVCGSALPSLRSIVAFDWSALSDGPNYVNPSEFPNTVLNTAAGQASIRYRLRGAGATIVAGSTSALHAFGYAARALRLKRADVLLAGGYEEYSEELDFGVTKTGCVGAVTETCALLMLERQSSARQRGATPAAEFCGFSAARADSATSQQPIEAAAGAMTQSLNAASIAATDIGCIVVSGAADRTAISALKEIFTTRLPQVPAVAMKSRVGETLGASGALAALTAALCLKRGAVPPSGAVAAHEELRLLSQPLACHCEYALVLGLGCDGSSVSLVLRRCPGPSQN